MCPADNEVVKVFTAIGAFVLTYFAMTVLLWVSLAGSWITFGHHADLQMAVEPSYTVAVVFCIAFWLGTRRKSRTIRGFVRYGAISSVCFYIALCGVNLARKPPTRFAFLGSHKITLPMTPSGPDLIYNVYSFPGDPKKVMDAAAVELASLGYKVKRRGKDLDGFKEDPGVHEVTISPARAIGKHWLVDGDMLDVQKRNDWVTVEVIEPDTDPFWIQIFLPL